MSVRPQEASRAQDPAAAGRRRELHLKLAWALVAKFLGLGLLWFLFFRGGAS